MGVRRDYLPSDPAAVVFPKTADDVRGIFRISRAHRIPITFRAAGTSLSGWTPCFRLFPPEETTRGTAG